MKSAFLTLGLTVALLEVACDSKEQCVADCDGQGLTSGSEGSESGSSSEVGSESSSGGGALLCEQYEDDVTEFIEQNRDCQTVLDCVEVDGLCYGGDAENPCGSIGLSASADLDAWQSIYGELTGNCECEAGDPCGSALMCNEQQQCEASFGSEAYCPSIERDVETFLAANRACQVDDDCVQLSSTCYVDDCSVVGLNVDTDAADWARLDELLWQCDVPAESVCNFVGDCGAELRCGDSGQCETSF